MGLSGRQIGAGGQIDKPRRDPFSDAKVGFGTIPEMIQPMQRRPGPAAGNPLIRRRLQGRINAVGIDLLLN